MQDVIVWMQGTALAHFMGDSKWAWPWAEVFHFVGMSLLFGSVLIMDLRLLGFLREHISIRAVHALAPWGALGFFINLVTGIAFLAKDADRLVPNPSFVIKMIAILIAGVNLVAFALAVRKPSMTWSDDVDPPITAKMIGGVSLTAWLVVIWAGRMIPAYGVG